MKIINNDYKKDILLLLKQLVAFKTHYPPGHSVNIIKFIKNYLKNSNLDVKVYYEDKNKPCLIAKNFKGKKKSIVFNSHIDTIKPNLEEWKTNPYFLKINKQTCVGLGAVNCKGSAAVQLYVAKNLNKLFPKNKENICFTFVVDEENLGREGTFFIRKKKYINPHTLILGAPTSNSFITEERGVFWAKITSQGKTSHAGEPNKGINAINKASKIILKLNTTYKNLIKRFDFKKMKSTINIGLIKGGENTNVVPYICEFYVDRRLTLVENVNKSFNHLRNFIKKIDKKTKIKFLTGTNPFSSNRLNLHLKSLASAYRMITKKREKFIDSIGVSDGRYFSNDKINIINFGPGNGNQGHKSNETLLKNELFLNYLILVEFLNLVNNSNNK